MIYLMSNKYLRNHIYNEGYPSLSLAYPMEYVILDCDCHPVTGTNASEGLSAKYNKVHMSPGICPEIELWNMIVKIDAGESVSRRALESELSKYLKSKQLCAGIDGAYKAQIANGRDTAMNVFIVLPNLVWSYLGEYIRKTMLEYMPLSFDCVYTQLDLERQFNRERWYPLLFRQITEANAHEIYDALTRFETDKELRFDDDLDTYGNPIVIPQQGEWTTRVRHMQTAADSSWYM